MVRKVMNSVSGGSGRRSPSPSPSPQPKPTPPGVGKNRGGTFAKTTGRVAGPVLPKTAPYAPQQPQSQSPWNGPIDMGIMGGDPGGGMAPSVAAPSEEDYLSGDAGFQTQQSALQGALKRFLADADFQRNNYNTDYGKSLRDLGYDEGSKNWNWNDPLTASGRGYQNQINDFGARGMLQSSGYADAFQELQRMLGQQYDSMSTAKGTFMTDLDNQIANYRAENTANSQAARAEALARRAAQYGL